MIYIYIYLCKYTRTIFQTITIKYRVHNVYNAHYCLKVTNSMCVTLEQQGSWQTVLYDAPKIFAILDHFYHPELLQNSTAVRS